MAREVYAAQVALLVRLLPFTAQEEVFALKGGTAINLFYRDMLRLSVDIDLTYLPVRERQRALQTSTKRSTGSLPPPRVAYPGSTPVASTAAGVAEPVSVRALMARRSR